MIARAKALCFEVTIERPGAVYTATGRAIDPLNVSVDCCYVTHVQREGNPCTRPLLGAELRIAAGWIERECAESAGDMVRILVDDEAMCHEYF